MGSLSKRRLHRMLLLRRYIRRYSEFLPKRQWRFRNRYHSQLLLRTISSRRGACTISRPGGRSIWYILDTRQVFDLEAYRSSLRMFQRSSNRNCYQYRRANRTSYRESGQYSSNKHTRDRAVIGWQLWRLRFQWRQSDRNYMRQQHQCSNAT